MLESDVIIVIVGIIFSTINLVSYLVKRKNDAELIGRFDVLINKFCINENELKSIKSTVDKTWEIHDHYDTDGLPSWYVPRSWATSQDKIVATQEKMLDICRLISNTQKTIADTLERIDRERFISRN